MLTYSSGSSILFRFTSKMLLSTMTIWLLLFSRLQTGDATFSEYSAPTISFEPPSSVTFLNSSGMSLRCSATGNPNPDIYWVLTDGTEAIDVPGLRISLSNGTLVFPPFRSESFRQDIHSLAYRCVASNSLGKVGSRDIQVKAVLKPDYEVQTKDEIVIRGNTAILYCHLPKYVKEYVTVTSWEREDGMTIVSNVASGGRYSVLANGELHIRDTMMNDGFHFYRCHTRHALSGEGRFSMTRGRLIVIDAKERQAPKLSSTRTSIHVQEGEPAELTCAAQAFPLPGYKWYKNEGGRPISVDLDGRVSQVSGSLYFRRTYFQDTGSYVCVVTNSVGEQRMDSTLSVTVPLQAFIGPKRLLVDAGSSVTLTCNVTGYPIETIYWMKNQRHLAVGNNRVRVLSRHTLHLTSVKREDKGVYQCYSRNKDSSTQASVELMLGETLPAFLDSFNEQIIQPGPGVSLRCIASGTPLPQVTWSVDGFPVQDDERVRVGDFVSRSGDVVSHVNITDTHVEDGGLYTCTAKNEVGKIQNSARLNVYGLPSVKTLKDRSVVAGENLLIHCRVAGYPIEEVTWDKGGKRLPTNKRQRLFRNASLAISNIQKVEDEGIYSCTARNRDGATAMGSVKVTVQVKPVILPFNFPREIQEGMKIRLFCTVATGDPPFQLSWYKDSQPLLPERDDVIINIPGEDYSSLIIESARPDHNGRYTCNAKNAVSSVNYTATLVVRVPPRWRIKPSDLSVVVGRSVTLHCQAEGYPQPQIVWERKAGSKVNGYQHISTSYHHQVFENGSLTIEGVTEQDAGLYLCQATNGIGPELSTVVNLSVHFAPQFHTKFRTQMAQKGESFVINCHVTGDLPIFIDWLRDQHPLDVDLESRIEIRQHAENRGMKSQLQIFSASRSDSSLYTCRASNNYGSDETNIQLIIQEPPDSPREIKLLETGSREVAITWSPPFSGNSLIVNYTIQWRSKGVSTIWETHTVLANETSFRIHNLYPAQTYEVRMLARNVIGTSQPGNIFMFSTEEEIPESPPEDVRVEAIKPQSLHVSWKALPYGLSNGIIQGYYIGYKITNTTNSFQYKTVKNESSVVSRIECELRGLEKYTSYTVVVQAFNRKGAGPRSDPVIGRTQEDVPSSPPQQSACIPMTSQSMKVTWQTPPLESLNGVLKGYKIIFVRNDDFTGPQTNEITVGGDKASGILHKLEKFCNYSITILAFTRQGNGKPSEPILCTTLEDVPGPPADIKAMPMLPDAILISWRPPLNPNGIIRKYTLYQRTSTGTRKNTIKMTLPPSQRHYKAQKLPRNWRFEFWVTASTAEGESEATRVLSQTTSDSVPARIASFSEHVLVTRGSSLVLPCQAVGIPAPKKKWSFRGRPVVEGGHRVRILVNGSLYIPNIQDNDFGNYTCHVENSYGADEISFAITVRGYLLSYRREYGSWEEMEIPPDRQTATIKNLHCGTRYLLRIAAVSQITAGEYSKPIYGRTEGKAPQAPAKGTFIRANSTYMILYKEAWNNGRCPIRSFIIRYKRFFATDWTLVNNDAKSYVMIRDLSPGTWYKVWVTSHNEAGSTVAEYDVATLTLNGATVAPVFFESSRAPANLWEDLNIIIPIVAAVVALSVVLGVAICVCLKKRQNEEIYERRGGNSNSFALVPPSGPKKYSDTVQHQDTPIYQSVPKSQTHLPEPTSASEHLIHDCQRQYYDDELAPYATFRLPGCDSDTESSQGTVRELQTFGNQYERSFPDPSAQQEDPTWQNVKIGSHPKRWYRIFDVTDAQKLPASSFWEEHQNPEDSVVQVFTKTLKQLSKSNEPSRLSTDLENGSGIEEKYLLVTKNLETSSGGKNLASGDSHWRNLGNGQGEKSRMYF
ncbi:Down syndrome cell adhesion molecule-like protein Dscam2 isoform X2 [Limulus polyphemus]|uniref:Down syndrome cell adhesion molecule-like protein Dscam2 isoform X2 n=1 Tax=Limulus polyphemus TaxID=6850 RepID=A0ABM1SJZ3_LIMPO|nr:Down syndrome cell adhesion molecule-like protein Dscam2 isoform X2 [Limulus polyphemus]